MSNALEIVAKRPVLNHTLTVYGNAEDPLFLAKDVAEWIEHSNVTVMISSLDPEEVTKHCLGGLQGECNFLTESGLYEVLMLSRKPIAKQFKREVKRILHELRTKGTVTIQPDLPILPERNTISAGCLANELKISSSQIHGIIHRNRELFQEGKDFIKRKQIYFTPSGADKIRRLASITSFQYHTNFKDTSTDAIYTLFEQKGYSMAMYLTYLLLLNWYELDDRKMFNVITQLNDINNTRIRKSENPLYSLVEIAHNVAKVKNVCHDIYTMLRDKIMEIVDVENLPPADIRVTERIFQNLQNGGQASSGISFRNATMKKE